MESTLGTLQICDDEGWEEVMSKDIMIKKIKEGKGDSAPMGTVVRCNTKGYFVENSITASEAFEILSDQVFKIGEGDAIPALELTLRHTRVGRILYLIACNIYY